MTNSIKVLYETIMRQPFPSLGKRIGDFPLYDSLLMGIAASYLEGVGIKASEIPVPDGETEQDVSVLRRKTHSLSEEEKEFLAYFDSLESLRKSLLDELK
jgi:hypothetical protein